MEKAEEEIVWEPTESLPWDEGEEPHKWLAQIRRHPIVDRCDRALLIRYTGEKNLMRILGLLMSIEKVDVTACVRMEDPEGRGMDFTPGLAVVCISEPLPKSVPA